MTAQILFLGAPLGLTALAQGLSIKYGWLSRLRRPLDGFHTFRGRRLFGDHKTWRGLTINVAFSTVGAMIQAWLHHQGYLPRWLVLVDYQCSGILIGMLLGLGMTFGELPNSFLKRQLDILPGKGTRGISGVIFFLFDQIDLAMGIWVFLFFLIRPSPVLIAWSLVIALVLHVAISIFGYCLGLRDTMV